MRTIKIVGRSGDVREYDNEHDQIVSTSTCIEWEGHDPTMGDHAWGEIYIADEMDMLEIVAGKRYRVTVIIEEADDER